MDRPMRAYLITAVVLFAAPQALAQVSANSSDALAKGIACTAPAARTALEANMQKAVDEGQATSDAIRARLNQISADAGVCQAVRDAAGELASPQPAAVDAGGPEEARTSPSAVVAEALAEAERRVRNLQFEVGPPPRNMTKGRTSGT